MKMRIIFYSFAVALVGSIAMNTSHVFADGSCLTVNNGGTTTRQVCITPTVWPTPAPFKEDILSQNSSGQTVYSPSKTKTTPDTGPDDWSLFVLAAVGVGGIFLRNKAKT